MSGLSIAVTALPAGDGVCRVIRLAGEADLTSTSLRDTLAAVIAAEPRLILIEMSDLAFIDSAATQMILSAHHVLRRQGGTLALVSPAPIVTRVLSLLGVDQVIRVYNSIPEATGLNRRCLPGAHKALTGGSAVGCRSPSLLPYSYEKAPRPVAVPRSAGRYRQSVVTG